MTILGDLYARAMRAFSAESKRQAAENERMGGLVAAAAKEKQDDNLTIQSLRQEVVAVRQVMEAMEQQLADLKALRGPAVASLLPPYHSIEHFRWAILTGYGFNAQAISILASFPLVVKDLASEQGGGLTYHDHVELNGITHEAALHELSHVIHERDWGLLEASPKKDAIDAYLEQYARLAAENDPRYAEAAAFARLQLHGDGAAFPGILALKDWDHAFVSLASWCMNSYKTGPRSLPEYMWTYFERFSTGELLVTPYYMIGGIH